MVLDDPDLLFLGGVVAASEARQETLDPDVEIEVQVLAPVHGAHAALPHLRVEYARLEDLEPVDVGNILQESVAGEVFLLGHTALLLLAKATAAPALHYIRSVLYPMGYNHPHGSRRLKGEL